MSFSNLLMKSTANPGVLLTVTRQGHVLRGKPPGVARTLEQRLRGGYMVGGQVED